MVREWAGEAPLGKLGQNAPQHVLYELEVIDGPDKGKVFRLKGQKITVGRLGTSAVCLRDPAVSGQHAELIPTADGYSARDLGSKHGIVVSGQAVAGTAALKRGDVIVLGDTRMLYRAVAVQQVCPKPAPKTSSPDTADDGSAQAPSPGDDAEPEPDANAGDAGTRDTFILDPSVLQALAARHKVATLLALAIALLLVGRCCSVLSDRPSDSYVFAPGQEGNLKCKACGARFMGTLLKAPGTCNKCGRKTAYFVCKCLKCGEDYLAEVPRGAGFCPKCEAKE